MNLEEAVKVLEEIEYELDNLIWNESICSDENIKALNVAIDTLKKYRWHDLRDNPNDLPDANYPSNTWFEVVQKDNEEELPRAAMQYDDVLGFGFYHDIFDPVSLGYVDTEFTTAEEEGLAEVVAWREIEEFESEEEDENS
nr:MAG TPA: hypothetical protein [Caudoviricetes sp.]